MSQGPIYDHMQFLAGALPNRAANTHNERAAAQYIFDQFKKNTPDVEIDDFYSLDAPYCLFASYYAEFTIVALIAFWWPRIALCYGAAVFILYLAEFSGYHIMGRFLPQYETQNIAARFLAPTPRRTLVVMAHYDSGPLTPLAPILSGKRLRSIHFILLACMLLVILSCAAQALHLFPTSPFHYSLILRWAAAATLIAAAAALFYASAAREELRGANDNASGAALLLGLAQRLAENPIQNADVILLATGANSHWMHGARHFLATHPFDRETTYFINLLRVGQGTLTYTTREGLIHPFPCAPELIKAAQHTPQKPAKPQVLHDPRSDALIPLTRGYKAITLSAQPLHESPKIRPTDTLADIDYGLIAQATQFSENFLRHLSQP